MKLNKFASFIITGFLFYACSVSDSDIERPQSQLDEQNRLDKKTILQYLDDNNINAELVELPNDAFYYKEVTAASGEDINVVPKVGQVIEFHWKITSLSSGRLIAESNKEELPTVFQSIEGLTLYPVAIESAFYDMNVGESIRVFAPSSLSYGNIILTDGYPSKDSYIIDLTLVSANNLTERLANEKKQIREHMIKSWRQKEPTKPEGEILDHYRTTDSGVYYRVIKRGLGEKVEGKVVEIKYKGRYLNDQIFDQTEGDKRLQFKVGSEEVIQGFDEAISKFKIGDSVVFYIPSSSAYGAKSLVLPEYFKNAFIEQLIVDPVNVNVPPHAVLKFEASILK